MEDELLLIMMQKVNENKSLTDKEKSEARMMIATETTKIGEKLTKE